MATALGISRKNIYRQSILVQKDKKLVDEINKAHETNTAYGQYKMALHLGVNHKRVERVMKLYGIKAPRRKSKKYFCTVSVFNHSYTNLIADILPEQFTPHLIWVCDVSYFKYQGQFWYLASIEDLATRQILASKVGKYHNADLILAVINQAITNTGQIPKYFHTDQGKEFMAKAVTGFLESRGTLVSVSTKASPWQNGYKESFFGHFKDEFGDINRFDTAGELIEEIYSQISYYNFGRIHRSLKMSPVAYTQLHFPEYCLQKWGA